MPLSRFYRMIVISEDEHNVTIHTTDVLATHFLKNNKGYKK